MSAQQLLSTIVDASGKPFAMPRARADGANGPDGTTTLPGMSSALFPYDASAWQSQDFGNWFPLIRSPDAEINQFRDRMVARSRDLERNSGWASGGIARILDSTIGTDLRLIAQPDYRALASIFKKPAFDATWADEFRRAAEARWRVFSSSIGRWNDVSRQLTVGQQFRVAMRHKLIDGEALSIAYWLPDRVGRGAAQYATSFLLVDPDRLSNPYQMMDTRYMRGGVEIDDKGVPLAIHIRGAEQNDWYNAIQANTWERVEYEDEDGWRRVFHDFEHGRSTQHRGIGVFTPILGHMKMLARYYNVELQAATIASVFGTYVSSPYDPALVQDAMGADDSDTELPQYQSLRADWHNERPAMLNGAKMPTLFPGEKIESVSSQHPHANFSAFAKEMLSVFASATGLPVELVTQDWSKTNYSSMRGAAAEAWKGLTRRKDEFTNNTAGQWYSSWLCESMDNGELPLPNGAPKFIDASTSYARSRWLGPARGYIDGVKEAAGSQLRMESGLSTLDDELSDQQKDWEEVLDQREIEIAAFKKRGIPVPEWGVSAMKSVGSHDASSPNYENA